MSKHLFIKAMVVLLIFSTHQCFSQDSSKLDKILSFPNKLFGAMDKKTTSIEGKLDKQTAKYLSRMERQEHKLKKKLWKKDSLLAKQLFDGVDEKYATLKNAQGSVSKYTSIYSGHLDSLTTALSFLKTNSLSTGAQNLENNPELQKTLAHYRELQGKLNASAQINKFITQRKALLKQQFQNLGMVKELKKYKKEVYYYQAQVKEYKQSFEDPTKLEQKLLTLAQKLPQFKNFFAKNSILGQMFALPGGNSTSTASLAGLQTRAMVNQSIAARFGSSPAALNQIRGNVQSAEGQLSELKSKLSSYTSSSYGNSGGDVSMPDGFKPNGQKTKSFLQRLELGTNFQSQRARYYFPVTSDIGLSLGYKLSDKSIIGIGASYKLGWGRSWTHIAISSQGVGLRSYIDWKLKGSMYVSGGYEQNYRSMVTSIDQLKNYSAWQSSGLIGLSKKYQLNKKMKGEMKLLWDFLSYEQVPRTQPIVFRIGYSLK